MAAVTDVQKCRCSSLSLVRWAACISSILSQSATGTSKEREQWELRISVYFRHMINILASGLIEEKVGQVFDDGS